MKNLAPIALFVYKRPWHTQRTLESLAANEGASESELFIFCDGPKRPEDAKAVEDVRELVRSRQWCGKVNIIERDKNLGLANSIISGVTELCNKYGRVIVLEDDLVLSPYFLNFMNDALVCYENEDTIMHVSGYVYPVGNIPGDTFFFRVPMCWGWATWKRAWRYFKKDIAVMKSFDRKMRRKFSIGNSYHYWVQLELNKKGKIDSWFVFWYAAMFLRGGLALFPARSLVKNIGFDGTGTHCGKEDSYLVELPDRRPEVKRDVEIKEYDYVVEMHKRFFKTAWPNLPTLIFRKLVMLAKGKISDLFPRKAKNNV